MTRGQRQRADTRRRTWWWLVGGVGVLAIAVAAVAVAVVGDSGPSADAPVGAQPGERAPEVALPTAGGDQAILGGRSPGLIVASFLAPG